MSKRKIFLKALAGWMLAGLILLCGCETARQQNSMQPAATQTETPENSEHPSAFPTQVPTASPSADATASPEPTLSATPEPTASPTPTPTPTQKPTSTPTRRPTATPSPVSTDFPADMWGERFAEQFRTDGQIVYTDTEYQSENIHITVTKVRDEERNITYFVSDIYLRSLSYLRAKLAHDKFGEGVRDDQLDMYQEAGAILAVNGDYYGARDKGVVIRNGKLYRDVKFMDVCVLYGDGTMKTYSPSQFNAQECMENGAYQAWAFGPMLLEDGKPMTEFNSKVLKQNPRTAIGYIEPGHYCFVTVDGRQADIGYSRGMTMEELSKLMYDLGCQTAYNLDGGQTSMMMYNGKVYNQPYKGGRKCSDIVYIGE
ncbi:MAG: phosphodiester glycosidase family protein [Clostridiales bacterium]|nr:phosphodiester glycosidase family protein [Clostridiales bacterium]